MFIAGSVLMTIDPPFFFCWALATYLLSHAIFDGRRWVWPLIGVVVGVGSLAKYGMLLWLPTMLLTLWADRPSRRLFGTVWPWLAILIALSCLTPVAIWNQQHGWVTLRHVTTQTGTDNAKHFAPLNFLEFIGSQLGVVGPPVVAMMIGAAVYAWRVRRGLNEDAEPRSREMLFLLAVGLPFFTLTLLDSFRTKVQPNWPAPAYFTLIILAAYFISTRMRDPQRWRRWRMWVQGAVITGAVATPLLPHTDWLYPLVVWQHKVRHAKGEVPPANRFDPSARAKGWADAAGRVSEEMKTLGPNSFVLCEDYQKTAEMAFYLPGQPKTYCAGSYFTGKKQKRHSQYDVWPDRSLDPDRNPQLVGRDAIYVGYINDDVRAAFARVEGPVEVDFTRHGVKIMTLRFCRCFGFKGMKPSAGAGSF
jgi:undecaprenyl-diphosphatase